MLHNLLLTAVKFNPFVLNLSMTYDSLLNHCQMFLDTHPARMESRNATTINTTSRAMYEMSLHEYSNALYNAINVYHAIAY